VTNITPRHAMQDLQLSDPYASFLDMDRIDREDDEALADYYASLVDDREENE